MISNGDKLAANAGLHNAIDLRIEGMKGSIASIVVFM